MLKFFRRIRQKLLDEGSLRKYLIYAIGEIALVVIGILIALQINNWNQDNQAKNFELALLSEMKELLIGDYFKVEMVLNFNRRDQSSCRIILNHLDNNLPYNDSLDIHFRQACNWSKLMLSKSSFERAKSYGMEFIKDDTTRHLLTRLYEYYIVWSETTDNRQTQYYYNTVVPELTEIFEFTSAPSLYRKGVKPKDYESLKRNERYKNILKSNIENRQHENRWLEKIYNEMKELEERL